MYNMSVSLSTHDNREVEGTSVRKLKGEKRKARKRRKLVEKLTVFQNR